MKTESCFSGLRRDTDESERRPPARSHFATAVNEDYRRSASKKFNFDFPIRKGQNRGFEFYGDQPAEEFARRITLDATGLDRLRARIIKVAEWDVPKQDQPTLVRRALIEPARRVHLQQAPLVLDDEE